VKILWVKAGGLVPLDTGGKIRSFQILKQLSRQNEVTLFTYHAAHPNDAHRDLESDFAQVLCRPIEVPRNLSLAAAFDFVRCQFLGLPYSIGKYHRRGIARELRRLIERERFDVIVCDFVIAGSVMWWDAPCPKVLFTHNVEATIWKRHYEVARNPLWKAVCWCEFRAMDRAERRFLHRADRVLTVSDADKEAFSHVVPPAKIDVIPTGVDLEYFHPSADKPMPATIVFTGSMDWLPNEDGMLFFIDKIFPEIRQRIPDAHLRIVGRHPSRRLQEAAARAGNVVVTGRVVDIRPHVWESAVYVVPLRVGSGTRLKIYEAMAMGKPVVSTTVGAEGLPVEHDRNIVLADTPELFASHVADLLQDDPRRDALGRAARQLVEENYGWKSVGQIFEEILSRVAGKVSVRDPRGTAAPMSWTDPAADRVDARK